MKKYSQRDEQMHILAQFANKTNGTFLDIGGYHPETFSNTRALVELGWGGVYVEPSPQLMDYFREYYKDNENIILVEKAVSTDCGEVTFYDSQGDAIGSLDSAHAQKWTAGYDVEYKQITVEAVDVDVLLRDLQQQNNLEKFDFISIDIEGLDLQVFRQFDFNRTQTSCICVEWNGNDKQAFISHGNMFGFTLVHETPENLIFAR